FPIYKDAESFGGKADVIIDFSHPSALSGILAYAKAHKVGIVVATTGLSPAAIESVKAAASDIPVFYSANMSIGINLILELCAKAAAILEGNFDIEIVEKHHNQKVDAPSGTALMLADAISESLKNAPQYVYDRHSVRKKREENEIGIHSVRGGSIVGEHEVIFAGKDEVIEIKHQATSKEVFAVG
ncbi:MAG: 4-hydroxy-tetrahydrodipicolinate reductase, partial [Hydrogenoanaerobacterium sp.]